VIIGADEWGHKDIIGIVDGYRESAQSWKELLLDQNAQITVDGRQVLVGN
jgi:transposase-like protein